MKGSVAIGQLSEGKCCDWTIYRKGSVPIGKDMKGSVAIGQISEGKCCDWTNIGREVLRLDNYPDICPIANIPFRYFVHS